VVEEARANADYFRNLLPEYRERPELVVQKIYQDTVQAVLEKADEKMIIQPTQGAKAKEIRIQMNRDPVIKQESDEKEKSSR
jgi:predicted ATP-grasp superfamily ATP-dependent carboligase